MIALTDIQSVYFIGIGGIGMSALARYFKSRGKRVSGSDRAVSGLTRSMEKEGIRIHYELQTGNIPQDTNLVVYTPAIPGDHPELVYCLEQNYTVRKRAEILGLISRNYETIAVAGSHGKTTVSTLITHLLRHAGHSCTAFLGGISLNYQSNFLDGESEVLVVEADEYDRSFLQLTPSIAVVTAIDTDHLDVYGSREGVLEGFREFAANIKAGGYLLTHRQVPSLNVEVEQNTYALDDSRADFFATRFSEGVVSQWEMPHFKGIFQLPFPGRHNIENALAAIAVAHRFAINAEQIAAGLASFKGIYRRFEYVIREENRVFIDDYAHHPAEIDRVLQSVKAIYPGQKLTVVFQPHLYSRTRDLASEFAHSLEQADEIILLPVYPAREAPIAGVDSGLILEQIQGRHATLCEKSDLPALLEKRSPELLLTLGAGDIDRLVPVIRDLLVQKKLKQKRS